MSLFKKDERKSDVKSVTAYLFIDYRHRSYRNQIKRLYAYCDDQGYDIRWVGYSESDDAYSFECNGKKIRFDSKIYDEFNEKMGTAADGYIFLFIAEFEDPNEKPYVTMMYDGPTEHDFRSSAKIANRTVTSEEKDFRKRFKDINRINTLNGIGTLNGTPIDVLVNLLLLC